MAKTQPYDFSLLHKFAIEDTYIVLDINSGIVHSLSKEAWDFLEGWEQAGGDLEQATALLQTTLPLGELEEIRRALRN